MASAPRAALALALLAVAAAPGAAVTPFPYPLFKQCDSRWGNDTIETTTICAVGCLLSSTAMALRAHGIRINASAAADPGTLNSWLRTHGGYDNSNDFEEGALPPLDPQHIGWSDSGMHRTNDVPITTIKGLLLAGEPVIANVMNGGHFVLVVGWYTENDDVMFVNDPGFERLNYSYSSDIVGWRLFNMSRVDAR